MSDETSEDTSDELSDDVWLESVEAGGSVELGGGGSEMDEF